MTEHPAATWRPDRPRRRHRAQAGRVWTPAVEALLTHCGEPGSPGRRGRWAGTTVPQVLEYMPGPWRWPAALDEAGCTGGAADRSLHDVAPGSRRRLVHAGTWSSRRIALIWCATTTWRHGTWSPARTVGVHRLGRRGAGLAAVGPGLREGFVPLGGPCTRGCSGRDLSADMPPLIGAPRAWPTAGNGARTSAGPAARRGPRRALDRRGGLHRAQPARLAPGPA